VAPAETLGDRYAADSINVSILFTSTGATVSNKAHDTELPMRRNESHLRPAWKPEVRTNREERVSRCSIMPHRSPTLGTIPGNRLEALKGDRQAQCSVRINGQWRICFVWNQGSENVEIVD
jgi:hypothetical protein